MDSKSTSTRLDLNSPEAVKFANATKKKVRQECVEELEKADAFVVICIHDKDNSLVARSSVGGRAAPIMIKGLTGMTNQMVEEVLKSKDMVAIFELMSVMQDLAKKVKDE